MNSSRPPATHRRATMRSSCDFCYRMKKRCDGDGTKSCSNCRKRGDGKCTYSPRIPHPPRRRPRDPELAQACPAIRYRAHFRASPATGLVGTRENFFLNEFFASLSLLSLTSQSTVRDAMVRIMLSAPPPREARRSSSQVALIEDADYCFSGLPTDAPTSMFWSAIAIGALVAGSPLEPVHRYMRLAQDSLAGCFGVGTAEVARACTVMTFAFSLMGDVENFNRYLHFADRIIKALPEAEISQDLADIIQKSAESRIFLGTATLDDVRTYLAAPMEQLQLGTGECHVVNEHGLFQCIMKIDRYFGRCFFEDIAEAGIIDLCPSGRECAFVQGDEASEEAGQTDKQAFCDGTPNNQLVDHISLMEKASVSSLQPSTFKSMKNFLDTNVPHLGHVEKAMESPTISGMGSILMNGSLAFMRLFDQDMENAVERMRHCAEELVKFPGLSRCHFLGHVVHCSLSVLARPDLYSSGEAYDKLRPFVNMSQSRLSAPVPNRREDWLGSRSLCEHPFCKYFHASAKPDLFVRTLPPDRGERQVTGSAADRITANGPDAVKSVPSCLEKQPCSTACEDASERLRAATALERLFKACERSSGLNPPSAKGSTEGIPRVSRVPYKIALDDQGNHLMCPCSQHIIPPTVPLPTSTASRTEGYSSAALVPPPKGVDESDPAGALHDVSTYADFIVSGSNGDDILVPEDWRDLVDALTAHEVAFEHFDRGLEQYRDSPVLGRVRNEVL